MELLDKKNKITAVPQETTGKIRYIMWNGRGGSSYSLQPRHCKKKTGK
jgi:hypothetical protein